MGTVFNNNPGAFIDMNTLFPVLNDKVGLTSDQWKKAMENANYLYNHLGLADVEVGSVSTVFNEPGKFADVVVAHREEKIEERSTDYFDFTFYVPTPKIEAALTNNFVLDAEEMGMTVVQTPIYNEMQGQQVVVGYKFDFSANLLDLNTMFSNLKDEVDEKIAGKLQSRTMTVSILPSAWVQEDNEPYKYRASVNTLYGIIDDDNNSIINGEVVYELVNDQPLVFAKHGIALNAVQEYQHDNDIMTCVKLDFIAIEQPTEYVVFKIIVTGTQINLIGGVA